MSNESNEEAFDIFKMRDEEPTIFPGRSKSDESIDALREIFQAYRKDAVASTLDSWKTDYRNAQGLAAKAEVLKKRDAAIAYQREQDDKLIQQNEQSKLEAWASLPRYQRNKFFYEKLKQEDPVAFFSKAVTEMRIADKQALGLQFHLKGG